MVFHRSNRSSDTETSTGLYAIRNTHHGIVREEGEIFRMVGPELVLVNNQGCQLISRVYRFKNDEWDTIDEEDKTGSSVIFYFLNGILNGD